MAKRYYRSCMNEDVLEERGLKPMQRMLNATGGWPIIMSEKEWYAQNYTWQKMDNDYFQLYNFFILFDISYLNDNENSGIFMIHPTLHNPLDNKLKSDREQTQFIKLKTLMKVVEAFAKDKGIQISFKTLRKDIVELNSFETNLKNIGYKKKIRADGNKMTIAELQEFYDLVGVSQATQKINWLDKIQIVSKSLGITINASETVLVFNKEILHELVYLLGATPQHVIVNYLQWHVMNTFLGKLNKQMRDIQLKQYFLHNTDDIKNYDTINVEERRRWLNCIKEFQIKDALSFLYIKTSISADKIQDVSDIFNDIKEEMMDYIQSSKWLNKLTKNYMTRKIYDISLNIDYFEKWYDNQTALTEIYKELEIDDNYFENVLTTIKYRNIVKQRSFRESKHGDKSLHRWSFDFLSDKPIYDQKSNIINIPAATMKLPHFKPYESVVTNYARIGSIIGYLMGHYIHLNIGSYLDEYGNLKLNTGIRQAYERRSQCILRSLEHYHNIMLNKTNKNPEYIQMYTNFIKNETIAYFIGTQIAFAAFQRKKQNLFNLPKLLSDYRNYKVTMETVNLSKLLMTSINQEQLFFIHDTELTCGAMNPYDEVNNVIYSNSAKELITSILSNIEAFSEAFNCPVGSPMNPKLRCENWKEATIEEHFYYGTD
ncbi:membrane metallo-endopeptidase-like 1 [Camponotus floridanus]|uniref:membrane metallo-endopeptidase-like 1 n=1 Tax=Camponotus floridanus TaxID=104421 RepID=UPI00059B7D64|nr:membrane metallo-endopeptidase-like 1 [Camponotus floridanus]